MFCIDRFDFEVFSAMQVKQEKLPSVPGVEKPLQEMQCTSADTTKSSPFSLWADYFDTFPILTEFDLRAGVNGSIQGSSTTSSSSSSPSESWPSSASGSPFSDCETSQEDSLFIDDHTVPTSVIDEIVQTLKMDGYNFDHLSADDIIDGPSSQPVFKQEQEMTLQPQCYLSTPVYTSLKPPALQQYKYTNSSNNNNNSAMNTSAFDSDNKQWCMGAVAPLPSMGMQMKQMQQNITQQPQRNSHAQHQVTTVNNNYANNNSDSILTSPTLYNTFSNNFTLPTNANYQQYKFLGSPTMSIPPPPLIQTCEKSTETKPRRRRSSTSTGDKSGKPHHCKQCGASFKLSANLKQHQVIHTGEKPFTCDICKAMFTRLSSLKTHHRLHTGEKPHVCPYCNAAFADRSAMKAHKRIHTGERPYKCAVCSTSFTQLSHLNAHKRTHTGEKPYSCPICATTFKQLGHLKRHEKSHICNRM